MNSAANHAKPVRNYMTVSEVADLFHVSTKTVVRWANDGRLPYMSTLGGHRRFPRADIEALLAGQQHVVGGGLTTDADAEDDDQGDE
ncbi:MAG: helix-turn-helix domain-containing protein, partial [Acidimicrobiales bacterium]